MGGNLLEFTGNLSAPTASVTTAKCVFNGVVSTPGETCLLANIKHFYLNNILSDPEFMRIPLKIIPQDIIDYYNLTALVDEQGWITMRIKKGVYGLKQCKMICKGFTWVCNSYLLLLTLYYSIICMLKNYVSFLYQLYTDVK